MVTQRKWLDDRIAKEVARLSTEGLKTASLGEA
jgi:hypothetical protein